MYTFQIFHNYTCYLIARGSRCITFLHLGVGLSYVFSGFVLCMDIIVIYYVFPGPRIVRNL